MTKNIQWSPPLNEITIVHGKLLYKAWKIIGLMEETSMGQFVAELYK